MKFEITASASNQKTQFLIREVTRIIESESSRTIAESLGVSISLVANLDVVEVIKRTQTVRELLVRLIVEGVTNTDFSSQFNTAMKIIDPDYDKSLDDFKQLFRSGKITKRLKKVYEFLTKRKIEDDEDTSKNYYALCLQLKEKYTATIYTTNEYNDKITMSYGDKWKSCQRVHPCDLPKDHPLYDADDNFDCEDAGCYASNATSVAADDRIHMLYTSKDGKPYNMTHRALAIEIEQEDFNAIQLERLYPDEQSSSHTIAGTALHNAFIEAAKRLAKTRFPDVEKWVVASGVRLATTNHFYLDSDRGNREKTFVVFPASVCGDKDPQEWMNNYQQSCKCKRVSVGGTPKCTHCGTYIDVDTNRAVCKSCGGYCDDDEDEPFAWCEHCDDGIQDEDDPIIGYIRTRSGTETHYFCCEYCAEREGYYRVEDDDSFWHDSDIIIDIDDNSWCYIDNLCYSEYHDGYIPQDRAVWSEHLDSFIAEEYAISDGFYAEDGDELVEDNIAKDDVVYSELHKCYILTDYAVKHPVTQDWNHRDWIVKDTSEAVVRRLKYDNLEVMPIEDTVYSRTLGMRIAKADAWYPDGEDYNHDFVLYASVKQLYEIVFHRVPYVSHTTQQDIPPKTLYEVADYYVGYARSLYERTNPDESIVDYINHHAMSHIRWWVGQVLGISVDAITLDDKGTIVGFTYTTRLH